MRKRIAEGKHKGWVIGSSKPSYPEKFFIRVLDSYGLRYVFQQKAGLFTIDFAFNNKKIALEIDGSQHTTDLKQRECDKRKDLFLARGGWIVYRIPWHNINSDSGKQKMRLKIESFLSFYKSQTIRPSHQILFQQS